MAKLLSPYGNPPAPAPYSLKAAGDGNGVGATAAEAAHVSGATAVRCPPSKIRDLTVCGQQMRKFLPKPEQVHTQSTNRHPDQDFLATSAVQAFFLDAKS